MTYFRYCFTLVFAITMTAAIAVAGTAWAQGNGQPSVAKEIRIDVTSIHAGVDMASLPDLTVREPF